MTDNLNNSEKRPTKRMLWGFVLIGAGVLFLLDRMDIYEFADIWRFWPGIIALAGAIEILSARRVQDVTRGMMNIVVGFWLYVSIENLWGLTFGNSWPILMIAFGITVLINGFVDRSVKSNSELQ